MAIEIGDAVWKIKGDAGDLDNTLANTEKSIGASFKRASVVAGAAMTAIGATITGVAAKAITDFMDTGSAINDMALRTGFGTTALQELGYAAGLSGGSMEDVETAAKKMSKVIFEAGEESKKAGEAQAEAFAKGSKEIILASGANTDALAALGLKYADLKGMKPEEQFKTIGFALADVKDATDRAALAQAMFGRSGTALLPMLSEGRAGFAAMSDEAHRLGLVMDEESVASADALGDEWDKLKSGLRGLGFDIAEVLIPSLIELATDVRQIMETFSAWRDRNPALFDSLAQITVVIGGIMTVLGPLLIMLPGITAAMGLFGGAATAATGVAGVGGMAGLGAAVVSFMAVFGPAIIAIGAGVWTFVALTQALAETQAAQAQLAESSARLTAAEELHNEKLRAKGTILDEAIMREMTYEQRLAYRAQQEAMNADITLRAWIAHFAGRSATEEEFARARNVALNENVTAQEAAMMAIQDVHGTMSSAIMKADAETTSAILDAYGIRKQVQLDGAQELTQSEISAATESQSAWVQANGAIAQSTVTAAEQTQSVWQRVLSFLSGGIQWLLDALGRVAQAMGMTGGMGPWKGVGMATGGTVKQSGWAVVGERGPELVQMPQGATVYDAEQSRPALNGGATAQGGQSVTINFNRDSVRSEDDIRQIERAITRLISSGMTAGGARAYA